LISAGPGTGKTYTLTRRIAHLMSEKGISADHIFAVTFTQKAADEMRQRLIQLLGEESPMPLVGTFHAICFQILKKYYADRGRGENLTIVDDDKRFCLVKDAMLLTAAEESKPRSTAPQLAASILTCKQQLMGPSDDLSKVAKSGQEAELRLVYAAYQVILHQQDSGHHQRVYSEIRGARTIRIIEAASEKAEAKLVHQTIEQLVGGTGFFSFDSGRLPSSHEHDDIGFNDIGILYRVGSQGRFLVDYLEGCGLPCQIASKKHLYQRKLLEPLISLFKLVESRAGFEDLPQIGEICEFQVGPNALKALKLWSYQHQQPLPATLQQACCQPFESLPSRAAQQIKGLWQYLDSLRSNLSGLNVAQKLLYLANQTQLQVLMEEDPLLESALKRLYSHADLAGNDIGDFLKQSALQTDTDIYDAFAQKVALMTMHAAKGLEFKVVFIVGCEEGMIPYHHRRDAIMDMDEERRLFYVAMTRAQKMLFITHTAKRRVCGRYKKHPLSLFVKDIEKELLQKTDNRRHPAHHKKHIQLELF
jgi:superfamily I DNA/RNA helicase